MQPLSLPARVADPIYTRSEAESNELCDTLRQHRLLGLDIEWKVTYESGVTSRPTATLQLSTAHTAYVFQLSGMRGRFPTSLAALLQDEGILKTGLNIGNDALKLRRDFGIRTAGLVDLGKLAGQCLSHGNRAWNLADLVAETTGRRLPKELRMSDWEATRLSPEQLTYAARDAYASWLVCTRLLTRLRPDPLVGVPQPPVRVPLLQQQQQQQPAHPQMQSGGRQQSNAGSMGAEEAQLLRRMPVALVETTPIDPMQARRQGQADAVATAVMDSAPPALCRGPLESW